MAAQQLATSNGGTPVVKPAEQPLSTSERKKRLAEILVVKSEQGYRIESQTDTEGDFEHQGPSALVRHGGKQHRDPRDHVGRRAGPDPHAPRLGVAESTRSSLRPACRVQR